MSKLLLPACWSEQPLLTETEIVWAEADWDALVVVQLTEEAEPMVFCVLSPESEQLGHPEKLNVAWEQLPVQPEASTVKVLPFMISSESAPDCVTATDRAKAPLTKTRDINNTESSNAIFMDSFPLS
jgi:hypothetical protein